MGTNKWVGKDLINLGLKKNSSFGDWPLARATVDSMVSMVYRIPSYRISDLEIKLIFDPKYGIPSDILTLVESENLEETFNNNKTICHILE